jgi:hypothetical protein
MGGFSDGREEAHKIVQNASKMPKIKCFDVFRDNFKVSLVRPKKPIHSIWPTTPNFCPDIHQAGIWLIGLKGPKPVRIGTKG